jgi:hypothetical protein
MGRPVEVDGPRVVDAIFYVMATGCNRASRLQVDYERDPIVTHGFI